MRTVPEAELKAFIRQGKVKKIKARTIKNGIFEDVIFEFYLENGKVFIVAPENMRIWESDEVMRHEKNLSKMWKHKVQ